MAGGAASASAAAGQTGGGIVGCKCYSLANPHAVKERQGQTAAECSVCSKKNILRCVLSYSSARGGWQPLVAAGYWRLATQAGTQEGMRLQVVRCMEAPGPPTQNLCPLGVADRATGDYVGATDADVPATQWHTPEGGPNAHVGPRCHRSCGRLLGESRAFGRKKATPHPAPLEVDQPAPPTNHLHLPSNRLQDTEKRGRNEV